jgi:hypothetical protein
MNKILAAYLLVFGLGVSAVSMARADDGELRHWKKLAAQIRLGTNRAEVERILPVYHGAADSFSLEHLSPFPVVTSISGSGQGVSYHLSEHVVAVFEYDYTGIPRDASGKAVSLSSLLNRLASPVQITSDSETNPIK